MVTDPSDYSYLNGTRPDQREHLHDYWRGADRVVLMEAEERGGVQLCNEGQVVISFQPPEDATVFQGTQFVEVTMDWQDGLLDSHGVPQLWSRRRRT